MEPLELTELENVRPQSVVADHFGQMKETPSLLETMLPSSASVVLSHLHRGWHVIERRLDHLDSIAALHSLVQPPLKLVTLGFVPATARLLPRCWPAPFVRFPPFSRDQRFRAGFWHTPPLPA